ncbi:MAG TPA: MarR family transcriptional regulator [Thermoanaerobaculia bacterium]|nr:MarR family transcriptional regulator [Thermoanaerobaculia bacterium]
MGTHHKGPAAEMLALDAFIKLRRSADSISRRVNAHLAGPRLTESQFGVLEALHHLGPLSQTILAKKILRSTGNLTLVIDNLEKRGLVSRTREEADRRYVTIALTESGERMIRSLFPAHVKRIVSQLAALSTEEQLELARLCKRLGLGPEISS